MNNVRDYLNWTRGYYEINREERNLAAILYHLLLLHDNPVRFLGTISCKFPVKPDEVEVYFEYSYLRDLWHSIGKNESGPTEEGINGVKREIIYRFLRPNNTDELRSMSTQEFNTYFGAVPRPSLKHIQSPATWSIGRYGKNIHQNDEFLRVCKFKWAFRAKPDIVIHTSRDDAICVECKFESGEGKYPSESSEIREFQNRKLGGVTQTALQKYMMEELLGIRTQFVLLVQKEAAETKTRIELAWEQAFSHLNKDGCPRLVEEWIESL